MSVRMMQPKIGWTDLDDFCMDINHWSVVKKCNRTLDGAEPRRTTAVGCPGGQCGATWGDTGIGDLPLKTNPHVEQSILGGAEPPTGTAVGCLEGPTVVHCRVSHVWGNHRWEQTPCGWNTLDGAETPVGVEHLTATESVGRCLTGGARRSPMVGWSPQEGQRDFMSGA